MTPRYEGLFEDILVQACVCGGLFMSPQSLDRLDDNIDIDASVLRWVAADRAGVLRCPSCPGGYRDGAPVMDAQALPGRPELSIDRCATCGWLALDHATLEGIRAEVLSLGRPDITGEP